MSRADELHNSIGLIWLWEVTEEIQPGDQTEPEEPAPDFLAEWEG